MTLTSTDNARRKTALARIRWDMSGEAIEKESFRLIEAECGPRQRFSPGMWRVARRIIHASADPSLAAGLRFAHDPVAAGLAALRAGAPIFCDSNMIRAGLSLARLRRCNPDYAADAVHCHISDPDIVELAARQGLARAVLSVEKARPMLHGAIVLVGNAPLALARVARFVLEEDIRPALVIGMPVGFVNVVESKEILELCPVPRIVLAGRRGGSALAVAALHAIVESHEPA